MKALKLDKSVEEGTLELLRFLLKSGKVKGVFTLAKIRNNGAVNYSLITEPAAIKDSVPLFPLMPQNAGKLLSRLTLKGTINEPIAVILRPCELRAFVELVKRKQGSLDNFLFISSTCAGVYPLEMAANGDIVQNLPAYWDKVKGSEIPSDIRATCKGCKHFLPFNSDMTIALLGKNIDKKCEILLNNSKAEKFVEGVEGDVGAIHELPLQKLDEFRSKREVEKKKLFETVVSTAGKAIEGLGLSGLIETFGKCIGCHGCSRMCPICYCTLCDFDSSDHEYEPSTYETELDKRGGMRVPPNTVFYHIGRLTHVGISCVGCGMCADVCPAAIPLSTIFLKVGEEVQKLFNYIPGKDVEEPLPLTKFEKDELSDVEE